MNNKDFISELSRRLGYTIKDTSELASSLLSGMTQELQEGNVVTIQGFGTFEVKKKAERITVNPSPEYLPKQSFHSTLPFQNEKMAY